MRFLSFFLCALALLACSRSENMPSYVDSFSIERYLGTWHERARFDHSFEKGLDHVTATYTLREDGKVSVVNRGYDLLEARWREAKGSAYLKDVGYLRVTFFWPFYGDYRVLYVDPDYTRAIVGSSTYDYLWILTRAPNTDIRPLVDRATQLGYDTSKLIYVNP
ncbi:MAG: lipocalin family protein [Alphaproteobacteria bacterium]|nr:lipocalin family protein [Alphaproteobacteria bacterium]MBN2779865.1 lipocalin family protein [Alphaproteobacteria bacterium]